MTNDDSHTDAAEALSDMTERPKEDFEPSDEYRYPPVDELEFVEKDGHRKRLMWTAFREAWFKQCSSPTSKERPEFEEKVARRVFDNWYSNNYE